MGQGLAFHSQELPGVAIEIFLLLRKLEEKANCVYMEKGREGGGRGGEGHIHPSPGEIQRKET